MHAGNENRLSSLWQSKWHNHAEQPVAVEVYSELKGALDATCCGSETCVIWNMALILPSRHASLSWFTRIVHAGDDDMLRRQSSSDSSFHAAC